MVEAAEVEAPGEAQEAPDHEALDQDQGRAQNLKSLNTHRSKPPRSGPLLSGAKLNRVCAQALSRELSLATWCTAMRLAMLLCTGMDIQCTVVTFPFQRTEL